VCASFVDGRQHELQPLARDTLHLPHATSLRMGRLGYQSDAQAALGVSCNNLSDYAASLHGALVRPFPPYERLGLLNLGGEYNQLATSLLQIENEFYSTIRPKRTIRPGERPLHALRERGVEYVEVRCMDLDPFVPTGIAASTMRVLDLFLLHCLLLPSPPDSPDEIARLADNQHLTAARGREPGLRLDRNGAQVLLLDWAAELLDGLAPMAAVLDGLHGGSAYSEALAGAMQRVQHPDTLPSARVLDAMARDFHHSHTAFVRAQSDAAHELLSKLPFTPDQAQGFAQEAQRSLARQRDIEAADTQPFEAWRQQYLDPANLMP
jgi:glutamate--cysteine ligase